MNKLVNTVLSPLSLIAFCLIGALNAFAGELPAGTQFKTPGPARVLDKTSTDDFNNMCDYRVIVRSDDRENGFKDEVQSAAVVLTTRDEIKLIVEIDRNANLPQDVEDYESKYEVEKFSIESDNKTVLKYHPSHEEDEEEDVNFDISRFDIIEENCLEISK